MDRILTIRKHGVFKDSNINSIKVHWLILLVRGWVMGVGGEGCLLEWCGM